MSSKKLKDKVAISNQDTDIAIIGMACRFPGAENYHVFWENLKKGVNSIKEVPSDRWDWEEYFGDLLTGTNKTNSKWGGFIEDVDKFDPSFFNISPKEAESMDPQQRIMLELTWSCIEDGGYSASQLRGKSIGVYTGACNPDYKELIDRNKYEFAQHYLTGVGDPLIANRISYAFNFSGPSLVLDTACSSSLVALHQALLALRNNDCELAIVGGINLLIHGERYISFSNLGMLSSSGQCYAFDNKANGYVRGEGAGVILLKPLDKAIIDKDRIYAVVKGSSTNHGGHARTLTSPNVYAQSQVIMSACQQANIFPDTISYIEAHGTGTPLGDPIEINGLKRAFSTLFKRYEIAPPKQAFCGVGAVKSNIGHLEAASGIAGIIKVILAMQHKKLPPLSNFEVQNSRIDLTESPFYLIDKLREWKVKNGTRRRAGVSSFGFGGANAHVIIEEGPEYIVSNELNKPCYLITLSAKHPDSLKQKIEDLDTHLKEHKDLPLEAISYTLNTGRSHFNYRCSLVVSSVEDLQEKLSRLPSSDKIPEGCFRGKAEQSPDDAAIYKQVLESSIEKLKALDPKNMAKYKDLLEAIANLYVKGYDLDWNLLHQGESHQKISLPTYPFLKERYWVDHKETHHNRIGTSQTLTSLHPLLDANVSTLDYQCFTKTLTGNEFYLSDHQVNEVRTLPGVAYLEMARAAGAFALPHQEIIGLRNVVWAQPIQITDKKMEGEQEGKQEQEYQAQLFLYPTESGVEFEVGTNDQLIDFSEKRLHAQGKIIYGKKKTLQEVVNLETIKERCPSHEAHEAIYERFKKLGLSYGPSFQTIKEIAYNKFEALATLQLPTHLAAEADKFTLHPSILDGALQVTIALASDQSNLSLPFSLGELEIIGPLPSLCYAYVRVEQGALPKFQIQILDENGEVRLNLKDFTVRPLVESLHSSGVYYYEPLWKESQSILSQDVSSVLGPLLMINQTDTLIDELRPYLPTQTILQAKFGEKDENTKDTYIIGSKKAEDYVRLFTTLKDQGNFPQYIIYHPQLEEDLNLEEQIQQCYEQLLYLSQGLIQQKPKEEVQILYVNESPQSLIPLLADAVSGFAKTLRLEHPKLNCRVVELKGSADKASLLLQELNQPEKEVRYDEDQKRWVKTYQEVTRPHDAVPSLLKKGGVYLITGGAGGLGLIFAKYLAQNTQGKLILTGRSKFKDTQKKAIEDLKQLGAEAIYFQTDVTQRPKVENLIQKVKDQFGGLNGIIHSAGILRDALILKKNAEEAKAVLGPKIKGTLYLDEYTQSEPLDFFVMFSSVASVFGNAGQSDYAYANGFMDGFASWRESLRNQNQRQGKTLSINWPLWAEGRMQVDESSQQWMEQTLGAFSLPTDEGIQAFVDALIQDAAQQVILKGQKKKLAEMLGRSSVSSAESKKASSTPQSAIDDGLLLEKVQNQFINIVSEILKIKSQELDIEEELSEYGMDSITLTSFANEVNRTYRLELTPALLFEHQTLKSFSHYLVENHRSQMVQLHGERTPITFSQKEYSSDPALHSIALPTRQSRFLPLMANVVGTAKETYHEEIAVIGMSGVFPGSPDLHAFWDNLISEKDLIREIPKDRWKWEEYYGDGESETKVKWGGFIEGVDQFDPSFFNISPREAELMDPQQRLFLQMTWKAIEDSGYTPDYLASTTTGLFVGVSTNDYAELLQKVGETSPHVSTGTAHSVLANRVSYLLNLTGPSEAVDTACSSSLVALHHAIKSIQTGDCELAIAGGVNALLTPTLYFSFSKAGMLCEDGRCKTFDNSANGYVRGEGAGALLLKPLSKAKFDGDRIYGIIKGSAVNHGGHVSSLTVPNPNAQAQLITTAIKRANVAFDTIGYIETHGTGTSLGDPIEINGLKKAFNTLQTKQGKEALSTPYCGLGAVKTNIGHLEAAAGIAGLIKVLLSLQHKKIPGNIHFKELNPYIELKDSPFYIVESASDWKPLFDSAGNFIPRLAGVSSFGFGGTNAHVVIEEGPEYVLSQQQTKPYYLVTLSAKHPDSLKQRIEDLDTYLKEHKGLPLEAISYTLNTGRSHFNYRCSLVVSSVEDLQEKLSRLPSSDKIPKGCFCGKVEQSPDDAAIYNQVLESSIEKLKVLDPKSTAKYKDLLEAIANLYVKGYDLDWNLIHEGEAHQKVSLPTYPFLKERYWVCDTSIKKVQMRDNVDSLPILPLPSTESVLLKVALSLLRNLCAKETKIPLSRITISGGFETLGIDSILTRKLMIALEKIFGKLPTTLLFKYKNLRELAGYFVEHHTDVLKSIDNQEQSDQVETINSDASFITSSPLRCGQDNLIATTEHNIDIAVIGMNGKYPLAENLEEYWENLKEGKNCVIEVPTERWDYKAYFDPTKGKIGKIYCKWGGFIADIDKFDPMFFNISPREAIIMDPQERLFLESVWSCLESSNYKRTNLSSRVGVFVGASFNNYQLVCYEAHNPNDDVAILSSQTYSIANRVSYYFNFKGPSLTVDTACSSSLYALHLACESIKRGECELAIAGGANLSLHPSKYATLCAFGFLASDGICHAFGEGGDGYVPGEGIGVVLLKPLTLALRDGDEIYGVIKGTAVSHDGKTYNYTVPNPISQSDAIQHALDQANIDPRTISYVEAHGTGTSLGDPIEITGLTDVYTKFTPDKQYCAMGSVKSNIGHLEAAAGIAGLMKVLLQMKYRMLTPTLLHNRPLNPNIDFSDTPFYVQQELSEWQPFAVGENEQKILLPRRAAISSFGAGGVNVHVVLEEHVSQIENRDRSFETEKPFIFVLSAKTPEALYEYVKLYISYLTKEAVELPSSLERQKLAAICYTLQTSRETMEVKIAFSINSLEELLIKLQEYLEKPNPIITTEAEIDVSEEEKEHIYEQFKNKPSVDPQFVIEKWLNSYPIPWESLYSGNIPQRLTLPTYPFAKRRCWPEKIISPEEPSLKSEFISLPPEMREWLYEHKWEERESFSAVNDHPREEGYYLIFSDGETSKFFKKAPNDPSYIWCMAGEKFNKENSKKYSINPQSPEDYQRLFNELESKKGQPVKIIYLWPMTHVTNDSDVDPDLWLLSQQDEQSHNWLVFFQALIEYSWSKKPSIYVITKGGQKVTLTDKVQIWQYHLRPFISILEMEQPEFKWKLIDLDPQEVLESQIEELKREIRSDSLDTYVALRANQGYVLRLIKQKNPAQLSAWRAPKAALVTGGLGALGFEVATWLVNQGVRHLFLLGNTILPHRSEWATIEDSNLKIKTKHILDLEMRGANVHYSAVDVSDRDSLAKAIEAVEVKWQLKIDGVFHLAGTTTDAILIENTSQSLLKHVLAPKIQGTLALNDLFKERSLSCFVLFSSTSAMPYFSINGLAAYATANAFMDGFAYYRQSLGLPITSINWTAWAEKGMSFEYKHGEFFALLGLSTLPISNGLQLMNYLLAADKSNAIILKVDWEKFFQINRKLKNLPYFSRVAPADSAHNTAIYSKYLLEEIFDLLNQTLAKVLIMQPEEFEPNTPLQNYGLDSSNGLVFITELSKVLANNPIQPTDLYRYVTLTKLSEYVYQQQQAFNQSLSLPTQPIERNFTNKHDEDLLDEIRQLSDAQAEAFLEAEIEEVKKLVNY